MRKLLPIIVLSTFFVSCTQEVLEPEQQISGMFALDDGSCLVRAYLSFENGRLSQYSATTPYPFAEGKIWHTDSRAFQLANKQNYSIRDGVLTASDGVSGPAELKDGFLTIGSKRYVALEGFEVAPYSRIVAQNEYVFTYEEQDISIPFTVENPLPGLELSVATSGPSNGNPWITSLSVQEGKVTAHISSTAEDRTGIIELSYTHAESVTVQIKQQPSTFITIPETSRTVDYTSSTQTLNYSIENPIATSSLTATSSVSWINIIQVSNGKISFDVQENNSGADRNATLTLRYEGARDVTFNILQRWASSSITLTPAGKEVDYTGGTFTFNYAVTNPREGISVAATSQVNWITNVIVSGNSISYKVAENNSGAQRTGKIKLTYGSYATAEFTVTQSWTASSITMTPSSQTTDYTGGSFNFSYAITNPRSNTTVTAASRVNWVTNVTVSGNSISYKVAENNSGAQRTGKIKLTYGSYATAEFNVTQSWTASSITLAPSSQTTDYTSGSFSFDFVINHPREGVSVTATSQTTWITDVQISGSTVIYKVSKNKSGAQRTGTIKLTYGSYATAEFIISQSVRPVVEGAVDLNLPSGLLWASCNLGANTPEDYGDRYAWGETATKPSYLWSTYKWCNGSYNTLTKYNTDSSYGTVDNMTVLEADDDVAHVKLGEEWRIPTSAEWYELRTKCTWTWTKQNGVNGRLVTASNGNSIFLPASFSYGAYWSSSLDSPSSRATGVHFDSEYVTIAAYFDRYSGYSVRPVTE